MADQTDPSKVAYFTADVVSYSDYLPFGQVMPNRHGDDNQYRYGFQGQERDDEMKGEGNNYTTFFRQLDPRIGRWFCIDPKSNKQPNLSPYISMNDNPVWSNDPFGDIVKVEGSKSFQRKTNRAIKRMSKTEEGARIYNKLNDDTENTYTIRQYNKNIARTSDAPVDAAISTWKVGDVGFNGRSKNEGGEYMGKGGWLSLGHELKHVEDVKDKKISNNTVNTPDR